MCWQNRSSIGQNLTRLPTPLAEKPEVAKKPTQEELVEKDKTFEFKVGVKGKPGEKKKTAEEIEEEGIPTGETVEELQPEAPAGRLSEHRPNPTLEVVKEEVIPEKPEITEEVPIGKGSLCGVDWLACMGHYYIPFYQEKQPEVEKDLPKVVSAAEVVTTPEKPEVVEHPEVTEETPAGKKRHQQQHGVFVPGY